MWTRRSMLAALGATVGLPGWTLARAPTDRRLVVVLLRGGLDGLAAVPATGDPAFAGARGKAAEAEAISLDGFFGLHTALGPIRPWWDRKDLAVVHAVALPYADRSHFDAQDLLESGGDAPHAQGTGWLARAVTAMGGVEAVAIGAQLPLLLRGANGVASLDPGRQAETSTEWFETVQALYARDPLLGPALAEGLRVREQLAAADPEMSEGGREVRPGDARRTTAAVARLLAQPGGPAIATIELGGWDTHVNQSGVLDRQLGSLADAAVALRDGLGEAWDRTAVLVMTEFGRRVSGNGTGGTDHGIGGAAFLLGGAVAGGRVIADWPGLTPEALVDRRDLRPTTDLRQLELAVCRDHLGVPESSLNQVFPGSRGLAPLEGLFRRV